LAVILRVVDLPLAALTKQCTPFVFDISLNGYMSICSTLDAQGQRSKAGLRSSRHMRVSSGLTTLEVDGRVAAQLY
jgi:hypothetical protein